MTIKYHTLALSFFGILCASASLQASDVVNINAVDPNGAQTLTLGPGTYDVNVVGLGTTGAAYSGWNVATQNFGSPNATPAPNDWTERFNITIAGNTTSYNLPNNPSYSSASTALAAYQSSVIYVDQTNTPADPSLSLDSATFTLAGKEAVSFSIPDYLFVDNWGGESLSVSQMASATPEPGTCALAGMALLSAAAALRRKRAGKTV